MSQARRTGFLRSGMIVLSLTFLSAGLTSAHAGGEADYRDAQELFHAGQYKEAASLLIRAVEQGHEAAQLPLAAMYRLGQGVKQDFSEAIRLFRNAAHQGYPSAQYTLGMMYRLGEGTKKDHGTAMQWFGRAASFNHAEAQNSLGVIYETGRGGVKPSYVTAVMWYTLAADRGSRRGRDNLKRLSGKMKDTQLAQAKVMAKTCERSRYKECGNLIAN